jgi:hypothetical protein
MRKRLYSLPKEHRGISQKTLKKKHTRCTHILENINEGTC